MLRDYQKLHLPSIEEALLRYRAALDASDTGTGKTYVSLEICRRLGLVPLVVGPRSSKAGWMAAAAVVGVDIEFVNYEKVRGKREIILQPCPRCKLNGRQIQGPHFKRLVNNDWITEVPYGKGSLIRWKNGYALVIFDEVHRCGGETSLNGKLLIAARRQAQYVLALSATAADDPRQMKALGYTLGLHDMSSVRQPKRAYRNWLLRHGCKPGVFGGFAFTDDPIEKEKVFRKLHGEIFPVHGGRMRKIEIPNFPKTVLDVKLLYDDTGTAAAIAEELHGLDGEKTPDLKAIVKCRLAMERLKVSHFVDLAEDYVRSGSVVIFVNFTDPLFQLVELLKKKFGTDQVGFISGTQIGKQGEAERWDYLARFQQNKFPLLVANNQAGGESANMHDPTGKVERTTLISPPESGRQFKQILGRVNRDGGAYSLQLSAYFAGTYEEKVADRCKQKNFNLDLLNDADLLV